jgi:chemotaxis family two-component system response regulator Rcp1
MTLGFRKHRFNLDHTRSVTLRECQFRLFFAAPPGRLRRVTHLLKSNSNPVMTAPFVVTAPFVLSVEDNDGDFALMKSVLQRCLTAVQLRRASDGEQALTFQKKSGISIDQPPPDLILLDVNLPRKNGFDVLAFIKSRDFICDAPVVMFTSSNDACEERKALALGAEEFVTKPNNLDGMARALKEICAKYLEGR